MKRSEPEQYLYEHPNLLDDSFSVSMTEAEQWAKEHPVSASEFVRRAKEKHPEIPAEQWADFEKAAAKRDKTARQAPVVRFRWWYVAVAAVVLIVLTFTLVPPARAWAESLIRYVFSLEETYTGPAIDIHPEGEVSINHGTPDPGDQLLLEEDDDDDESDSYTLQKDYYDLDTFISETGYHPVVYTADDCQFQSMHFTYWLKTSVEFADVLIIYDCEDGSELLLWTRWGEARGETLFSDETAEFVKTTVLNGMEAVGFVDDTDNSVAFEILLDDCTSTIMFFGADHYQEVLDALKIS